MKKKTKIAILIAVIAVIICLTANAILYSIYSPDIYLSINNKSVDNITAGLMEENSEFKIQLYQDFGSEYEILNEFSFSLFNIDCNIQNGKEEHHIYILNRDYIIVSFKSQGLHTNRTKYHKKDILVHLDYEENSANIVYESQKNERIIWGNSEQAVIYNFEEQFYQLIDLSTFSVIKQLNTEVLNTDTDFEIYPNENYFCLRSSPIIGPFAFPFLEYRTVEKISFDLEKIEWVWENTESW